MSRWNRSNLYPRYDVSDDGQIKNNKTGRIMKTAINTRGYEQVCLRDDNKTQHTVRVHRLVADAFLDGDKEHLDVNHIDGDKLNNRASNLEWCTRKENIAHAYDTGLKVDKTKVKVRVVETGEEYDSLSACSRSIGGDRGQIHRCLIGKEKSCRGYHFEAV